MRKEDEKYNVLVGGAGKKRQLRKPMLTRENVNKTDLMKCGMNVWTEFNWLRISYNSRDSSVVIATRLRPGRSEFDSRQGLGIFSLRHRVQTGSTAHPVSYPMGTRGSFPESKATGA
jgi:hypothetical protein